MFNRMLCSICAVLVLLSGCGAKEAAMPQKALFMEQSMGADRYAGEAGALAAAPTAEAAPRYAAHTTESTSGNTTGNPLGVLAASTTDHYLIKNAFVTLESENVENALQQITQAIVGVGGYVSGLTESVDGLGRRMATVTMRVPADQFDAAILHLEPLGKILNKQVTTEDVTEQYVDTDAQARNLKKMEERILAHLDRAGTLEEVLKVEAELSRVRDQIERLDGRLRYLGNRVSFSTLQITIQKAPDAEPLIPAETFSVAQTFTQALRGVVAVLQAALAFLIWIGVWGIVWIPMLLILWIIVRIARNVDRNAPPTLKL
ncbi:MAG: hypothetical protein AMXMBFR84_43410 [Candidatus Hydrogenedentota bacterium]